MPDIDLPTVIFALVALFVAYKLRSVLGTRNDGERPSGGLIAPLRRGARRREPDRRDAGAGRRGSCALAPPPSAGRASPRPRRGAALTPSQPPTAVFAPAEFLSGARSAYEMVVQAFAAGDGGRSRA